MATQPRKLMDIATAQSLWLDSLKAQYVKPSTARHYRLILGQLSAWTASKHLDLGDLKALHLSQFMASLPISQNTAITRVKTYKTFFRFCEENELIQISPARNLKAPRYQPPDKRPYSQEENIAILQACDHIGKPATARLVAKAAILVMRHHALRISDVAELRRDAFCPDGFLRLKTIKTGAQIEHPTVPVVIQALDCLPGAGEYYFQDGQRKPAYVLNDLSVLLLKVYLLSGVKGAQNHRFRHSRASEILLVGGSIADCARFLGISPRIAEMHYARFMPEHRDRIVALMEKLKNRESGNEALVVY